VPRVEPSSARRRLAAILSADAVGFSRRMAENDVATVETLRSHRETIRGLVREHHGRVVDAVGDNLLAEFPSAVDSVACAIAAQRLLGERNGKLPEERRLPFRIGLHLGDLLVDDERLYGDGVNIAARLEALSEPGGICVSGALVEQVRGKVDAGFVDLGEQELKNIPGPVRAWRVEGSADTATVPASTVPGFGGRPAVAVLPFENRSGDPEQEFLVDGIVEDVIARLSAFRSLPVIARSSTFTYKGTGADARRVSRELGARYVVEGSARKAGSRIRVAVQLVDGTSGHQIHAERYDRELGDIFDLQDEIAETLVGAIEPALRQAERRRAAAKPTASLDAWEALQRGLATGSGPSAQKEAREWFRRAIEIDPNFAPAYAWMAVALLREDLYFGRLDDREARLAEARELAETSVRLAPEDPLGHLALAFFLSRTGGPEPALRALERAVELNPSYAMAWNLMAILLADDRPDEALALSQKALRLAPRDAETGAKLHTTGLCQFNAGRYDEAIPPLREALERQYVTSATYRLLGAALGHAGQLEEAREALDEAMRLQAGFTVALLRRNSPRLVERMLEGWKKAGWSPPNG